MKKNAHVIRVTPHRLSKSAYWALLIGAALCTVAFAVSVALAICVDAVAIPIGIAVFSLIACACLWPCLWYYGHYLPKFAIILNMTEKEVAVVTSKHRVIVQFVEISYIVTTSFAVRPTYYLHLFHQGKKLIRINTGDWKNIRFLLDLPHKPDPKISKLRELRKYS